MSMYWLGLRDFWGRWVVDEAGYEGDVLDLVTMEQFVRSGQLGPRTWVRHQYTGRFLLAGEVLFHHGRITEDEFNDWVPKPVFEFASEARTSKIERDGDCRPFPRND